MPRVKGSRRTKKPEYIHTELCSGGGSEIVCLACGYNGKADLVRSTALGSGVLEKCPRCCRMNFETKESEMETKWKQDEWTGCYPSKWKGMIVPGAMAHPAKFSSKLIRRIYEHMRAEGWVKTGDRVIDPFGGVALGALDAMRLGLEWMGMELELKFVDLGCHNISNWELKFARMPNWGSARLVQGDSRKLLKILGSGRAAVSSPPYGDSVNNPQKGGIDWEKAGRPDRLVESDKRHGVQGITPVHYGSTEGQLGAMKGDSFASAVMKSPPFGEAQTGSGIAESVRGESDYPLAGGLARTKKAGNSAKGVGYQNQGADPANLSGMKTDGFDIAVSSPPFTQSNADGGWQMLDKYAKEGKLTVKQAKGDPGKSYPSWASERDTSYGESDGQLSTMDEGNFAAAMRSSPPYAETEVTGENNFKSGSNPEGKEANTIREKDKGYQASVSSPPFLQSEGGTGAQGGTIDPALMKRHAAGNSAAEGYGGADGQLGNMGAGDFDSAVSSPPYTGDVVRARGQELEEARMKEKGYKPNGNAGVEMMATYGETEGNIGNDSGSDFWTAARQIVEQVYLALAPGGHAVWVVKNYVKKKEMVPFSDQWRQLCEAVGFETLHEHRALMVHATSLTLDGQQVHKESKSFFRRLAEKKGSPRIDFETVYCMVKR